MSTLIRHLSTSLLCVLLALGHVPAWYHVSICEGTDCCEAFLSDSAQTHSACDCVFHLRAERANASQERHAALAVEHDSGEPDGSEHQHDSSSCSICQSLAAPCGFDDVVVTSLPNETVCGAVEVPSELADVVSALLLPPLRGPPVLTA